VFYGFTKTFEAIRSTDRNWVQLKDKILKQLSDLQPQGVINHSMVSHRDIAEMFQICGYWLYPTQFTEISCITAMKAQAGGCWPITTDIGALPETVKFGAVLKGIDTYTEEGKQKYLELVLNTVGTITDTQRKEMSNWAIKNFDWANVARQWSDMFISERRRK
jgi:glycosyltransferase involved in cell wall biosynthesis